MFKISEREYKLGIITIYILLYLSFYPLFYAEVGQIIGILVLIPIFLAGWWYGTRIVLFTAFFGILSVFLLTEGFSGLGFFTNWWPIRILIVIIGLFVGVSGSGFSQVHQHRQEQQQLLLKQNAELRFFAEMMAHDLRNFLSLIDGYCDLLLQTYDPEFVYKIKSNVQYSNGLLKRSLALAKAGQTIQTKEVVDLNEILHKTMDTLSFKTTDVIYDQLPCINGDPEKIYQIFKNLLENAQIHGKATEVHLRCCDDGLYYQLTVSNNGTPIDTSIQKEFNSADFLTSQRPGLGLKIVKKLVEAHQWRIDLQNNCQTMFMLYIPKL